MFPNDMTDLRKVSGSKSKRETFEQWAKEKCPNKRLSFECGKVQIAGVDRIWKVVSFGDYMDANHCARRFISYRCGVGTLSLVYSWLWDDKSEKWFECESQQFGSW